MQIIRFSRGRRYTQRTVAAGKGAARYSHGMFQGEYQPVATFAIEVTENGTPCQYAVALTMGELRELLAQLPAPEAQPLKPAPELDAAIELRMKRIDDAAKRRDAQLRGDGSPN